ncbi:MAG: arginine--tRNA ligase [Candidatus Peregrinibacteria bacterium]
MFQKITARACEVLEKEFSIKDVTFSWRRPQQKDHGDLATSIAMQLGKQLKKNPLEIAKVIAEGLQGHPEIERTEVAGPGYVNIWLKPQALMSALSETIGACSPILTRKGEKPVIIEYSQPNIAKPLGIHHIITTIVGQSLVNLHRHLGYPTIAINHLGDWGTQFGKLAVALELWGNSSVDECTLEDLLNLYVRFHTEAETDATLEDRARAAFLKLEQGDPGLRAFWKSVVDVTMQEINTTYERLGVAFDFVHGESFYEDKMLPIIEEGKKKGVFKTGEKGALIAEFPPETHIPPAIVLKGDGATIYHTRDLATVRFRIDHFHPECIIYLVDTAQENYFRQLFAMVGQLGWDVPTLEHAQIGRMSFTDRNMSTRKGNILRLKEVLDEGVKRAQAVIAEHRDSIQTDSEDELAEMMGVGSVVYGILSQNRRMSMVFDWDKVLSLEGNSAPYLQYTYARSRSVLRKGEVASPTLPTTVAALTDHERSLVSTLLEFPGALEDARASRMPHTLANYLYALCQEFNAFYNTEPILKSEEPARSLRLALTSLVATVLKTGAEILTLRVPERM